MSGLYVECDILPVSTLVLWMQSVLELEQKREEWDYLMCLKISRPMFLEYISLVN